MPPVRIEAATLSRVARRLAEGPLPPPPDFLHSPAAPFFPPLGAAWAVPFFFAAVPHLYGLWREDGRRLEGPVRGYIDGREFIGDDFIWKALWRAVQEEPRFLHAAHQAGLSAEAVARVFRADAGGCPVPLLESHAELARGYGQALEAMKTTPHKILESCRGSEQPAQALVAALGEVPGYREDPLRRKAFLLALILSLRPERFLPSFGDGPPALDRHALRLALRWGAVRVEDPAAEDLLRRGEVVPPPVEQAVRLTAYEAVSAALRDSGRTVPETFALFAAARDYCPEDRAPDCPRCFFVPACERRIDLRQPVVRTLSY